MYFPSLTRRYQEVPDLGRLVNMLHEQLADKNAMALCCDVQRPPSYRPAEVVEQSLKSI